MALSVLFKRASVIGSGLDTEAGNEVCALQALQPLRDRWQCFPELVDAGIDSDGPWVIMPFYDGGHPPSDQVPSAVVEALAGLHVTYLSDQRALDGLGRTDARHWRALCLESMTPYVEQHRALDPHPQLERALVALQTRAEDSIFLEALALLPATLVHGDVWSGNIIESPAGPRLVDCGCARVAPAMLDLPSISEPGLPAYSHYLSSWERIAGEPLDRADVASARLGEALRRKHAAGARS